MAVRLRTTGRKSSNCRHTGFGGAGPMARQTAIIMNGPSPLARKALRQPNWSATSWQTRNDNPTPTEKLDV
jgi:hypothetical protein